MSLKVIESVVRELQQTVATLVNKVESLESKISEQSAIIIKLSGTKDDTTNKTTAPTRKSLAVSAPSQTASTTTAAAANNTTAVQRPLRTARVQASAAITELSNATSKRRNVRAGQPITPKSDVELVICTDKLTCGNDTDNTLLNEAVQSNTTVATTGPVKLTQCDEYKSESKWEVVNKRRRRKQQAPIIVGTATVHNDDLQAAERIRYIQAWCFKPDTTTSMILGFLNKIIKSNFTVEKRDIKSERHASFLIGMSEKVYDAVTTPTAWPVGVRFTEWFQFRPRVQQRGSERTAAAGGASLPPRARADPAA